MNIEHNQTIPANPSTEGDVLREKGISAGANTGHVYEMDDDMIFDTALATMQVSVSGGYS
ncbi:hypothetical protein [Ochrobactrum sp. EDr1-4]|uniref:hypothetical protein n=1 Tax=Ochrobactrum sp. EDr1-4 TaxID=3368622 RepID=UPI003B9FBCA8